jgi:hypothetical protein
MLAPSCSLHVLLARRSPRAVVIRRGPTKMACLVAWDRSNDTFDVGQWFRGRIHEDRCDLSEDGALMVAFLASHRPPLHTWTVLCRPPFLTALALWPNGSTGGGRFTGPRSLYLTGIPNGLAPGFPPPSGIEIHGHYARLLESRDGDAGAGVGRSGNAKASVHGFSLRRSEGVASVSRDGVEAAIEGAGWADIDANGDLLFSVGGAIRRLKGARVPARPTSDGIMERSKVLVDLAPLRFRPLAAPYDSPRVRDASDPQEGPRLDRVSKEDRRARRKARPGEVDA